MREKNTLHLHCKNGGFVFVPLLFFLNSFLLRISFVFYFYFCFSSFLIHRNLMLPLQWQCMTNPQMRYSTHSGKYKSFLLSYKFIVCMIFPINCGLNEIHELVCLFVYSFCFYFFFFVTLKRNKVAQQSAYVSAGLL